MSYYPRVRADNRGGSRVTMGPSLVTPVCEECGSVLFDQKAHDEWHESIDALVSHFIVTEDTPQ